MGQGSHLDRLKIVQIVIYIVAVTIIFRLVYWQFIADVQGSHSTSGLQFKIPAQRGEILTSDSFPIVANQEAYLLYAKPNEINQNTDKIGKKLSPYLVSAKFSTKEAELSDEEKEIKKEEEKKIEDSIVKKISDKKLFWVQIARKLTKGKVEDIEKLKIEGIEFQEDTKRLYPESSMAAHLLGFVGSNDFGDDTGYFGLEGYYNNRLTGKDGINTQVQDPFGLPILVSKFKPLQPKKGDSLELYLDRAVQFIVEEKLKQAVEKYGAKEGTVIVSDVKTGGILAMSSFPSFNPDSYSDYPDAVYKNPAVSDTYEPGSTFKLVTMAAALNENLVTPTTKCDICGGPVSIDGYEISTWNKKYHPDSTMIEVLQHSDNVGMTFVSQKLGVEKFTSYIQKFGFGEETNIDLQGEAAGTVRQADDWKQIDLATASFGQGIAVTPIQMIQAVQAIANGGKMISPTVVKKIISEDKEEAVKSAREIQVITPKTAAQMTEMMVNAVDQGEAKAFIPKGYRIAGKTGTAQIPVAGHYDPNKTIASFIGFAPADDPKFVMLVRFTEPTSSIFGSETAAPTFFTIAKELFNYYHIAPHN